ncbi:MAG: bacteriocin family protein, partial [Desulfurococcales archaeon]|nr:bacteriocin family protein [Desulfurococcales archaeon]
KVINSTRILRGHMPSISVGRVNVYSYYKARRGGEELEELALKLDTIARSFTIPERVLRIPEELSAVVSLEAKRFVLLEEEYLIEKLRSEEEASVIEMSDWSEPGSALRDVSRAYTASYREGGAQDYLLLLPLSRFVNLLSFHEKSGVMELERVRRLVGRVLAHPLLKDDEAYLIPLDPYIASVLVSEDLTIAFPGLEASGGYTVRVWEVIGLRITLPSAIVKLAA